VDAEYQALEEALIAIKAATTVIETDGFFQLVCAAAKKKKGLVGNSFWFGKDDQGRWFLTTWNNRSWLLPDGMTAPDVAQLCRELLPTSRVPIYSVPDDIAQKHSLVELEDPFGWFD
jgi:hypothetical protein